MKIVIEIYQNLELNFEKLLGTFCRSSIIRLGADARNYSHILPLNSCYTYADFELLVSLMLLLPLHRSSFEFFLRL